ncbi:MAG TPA: AMP-binding protein [Streptosporangiaceae bacterium]
MSTRESAVSAVRETQRTPEPRPECGGAGILRRWVGNVAARPGDVAIRTRGRTVTYAELERCAARYRDEFTAVPGTDPVLVLCADPVEIVAAQLAAMAACRPFAPVSVQTPAPRLAALLDQLRPGIAVVDEPGATVLRRADPVERPAEDRLVVSARGLREPSRVPAGGFDPARWEPAAAADGADRGYVYFTSGTSGRPKGVRGSLEAVAHFVDWEIAEFGITAGTRVSSLTSPGFDAFLRDAFVPLCGGGTMCVAPRSALAGAGLARWLEANEIQVLHCVPTVFRTLRPLGLTSAALPALRTVLLAGETVRPADVRWWRGLFGDAKDLVNMYGASETTMAKLFHRVTAADESAERVPVGVGMPGVSVRVLGAARAGDVGEVEITVPFRLLGYLNGDPGGFDPADPYRHRTGDLGRLREDGELELLGRLDGMVKVRGLRIELDDVANVLLRHPAVHDVHVAVAGADSAAVLRAYVVVTGDPDEKELVRHARGHLPAGMVPDEIVRVSTLPRTLNGKVDQRRLLAAGAAGGSEGSGR